MLLDIEYHTRMNVDCILSDIRFFFMQKDCGCKHSEDDGDEDLPAGSRRILCRKCGNNHAWIFTNKTKLRARWCQVRLSTILINSAVQRQHSHKNYRKMVIIFMELHIVLSIDSVTILICNSAPSAQECQDHHPAKDGDGWIEQTGQAFFFGIFQKVRDPSYETQSLVKSFQSYCFTGFSF